MQSVTQLRQHLDRRYRRLGRVSITSYRALQVARLKAEMRNKMQQSDNLRLISKWFVLCAMVTAISLPSATYVMAQMDQGVITGIVQDETGAVVRNVQVTLTDTDTGTTFETTTNDRGFYVFPPAKVGNYKITASSNGFRTLTQDNIHLNVQDRLNIILVMQPGAVSQSVQVNEAPPLLQAQSGSVGQVMSTRTINNTPLNQRNWVYIAQLTAGVDPSTSSQTRGSGTGDFFANGQRATQNNFILDGVDNNVNLIDFMNGASYNVSPPPDALAEFKLQTNNYSAEFGHSAGAVLNASIKSGTNQIHGNMWEYVRNTDLDAKDWDALTIPPYHENQFGATLGLPILPNKLFAFGDAQANRIAYNSTDTFTVPTPLMRQGNFTELLNTALTGSAHPIQLYQPNSGGTSTLSCNGQNNVMCSSQIDSVAERVLNLYPSPNTNGGKTFANRVENLIDDSDTWQWDARMDYDISAKDHTYARLSYLHVQGTQAPPLGPTLDGSSNFQGEYQNSLAENVMFSETHLFKPNLLNEFRFGYNWGDFSFLQENYNTDAASQLGISGMPFGPGYPHNGGLPFFSVASINSFGSPTFDPSIETQNVYQILDNVTKILGNHSLKVGLDLQSVRISFQQPPAARGSYTTTGLYTSNLGASFTGYGVADFLANQYGNASISTNAITNDARWYRAAYVQDDWRVNAKVMVNVGLRYDYYQPYKEMAGRQANFIPTAPFGGIGTGTGIYQIPTQSQNVPLSPQFTALLAAENVSLQYVDNPSLVTAQKTNFGPRVGFVYQVDLRTVISGGSGIFYGGLESVGGYNLGNNYPFLLTSVLNAGNCAPSNCPSIGVQIESGLTQQIANGLENFISSPTLYATDPSIKTPYTIDYNLMVQRALSNNMVLSLGYIGDASRHLATHGGLNNANALQNPANSAQSAEPFPRFGSIFDLTYAGMSDYNSLQANLQKRYASGLSFLASYTWAHALDDSDNPLGAGLSIRNFNMIPIIHEYANSAWDVRNRFTFNGYYELPFGKELAHLTHTNWANVVAGGWATNLTFTAQSGVPFTVGPNISTASGGVSTRANLVRDPSAPGGTPDPSNPNITCPAKVRTRTNWYNPCAFANPLSGSLIPRTGAGSQVTGVSNAIAYLGGTSDQIDGPGYERIDLSVFKDFTTWREQRVEFRADIFNVLNHPTWAAPSVTNINSNAGQITGPQVFQNFTPDARFFQVSLKYVF